MTATTMQLDGVTYLKCEACENPMQLMGTRMCAPCTFGEADSFNEFEFIRPEDVAMKETDVQLKTWWP